MRNSTAKTVFTAKFNPIDMPEIEMKQELVSLLRTSHVLPVAERLHYLSILWRKHKGNTDFAKAHPGEAFPPCGVLYDAMSSTSYPDYFDTGHRIAHLLYDMAAPFLPAREASICEWGCGPGRIIRHMRGIDPSRVLRLSASDYNRQSVDWCGRSIPGVDFRLNGLAPPFPFDDGVFDWVYCISVFTHLSEPMHRLWLADLLRSIKTGGILLLTTHGDNFRAKLLPEESRRYIADGLVVRGKVLEGSRMYTAFESPAYMRSLLGDQQILLHEPDPDPVIAGGQDVWIVRKVAGAGSRVAH